MRVGVKFASFQVLREMVDYCLSVLLELRFLSNWDESEYFQAPKSIRVLSLAIFQNLIQKFKSF